MTGSPSRRTKPPRSNLDFSPFRDISSPASSSNKTLSGLTFRPFVLPWIRTHPHPLGWEAYETSMDGSSLEGKR